MAELAIGLWLVYGTLVFGVRILIQVRMTGSTGFVPPRRMKGRLECMAGGLFLASVAITLASPVLSVLWPDRTLFEPWQLPTWIRVIGGVLFLAGLSVTFAAQLGMGRSWRIGVDARERTDLVAHGLFRFVRNPIFSGMLLTTTGIAWVCSSWLAWFGCVSLFLALELQVRRIEEPHLTRVHGDAYRKYAATVGRFVPGVGRGVP